MKTFSRVLCVVLIAMLLAACAPAGDTRNGASFDIETFRDIPGITEAEIRAIEDLQRRGEALIVSTPYNTEAFIDIDGRYRGFTPMLCDWLSEFFELRFRMELNDIGEVLRKLNEGDIHFGILAVSGERQGAYYMSDPIIHRTVKTMRLAGSDPLSVTAQHRTVRYVFTQGSNVIGDVKAVQDSETYEEIIARNYASAYRMLESGEADAIISYNTMEAAFDALGGGIIEDFLPLIVSPASLAAADPRLEPIISALRKAQSSGAYSLFTQMYAEGYDDYKSNVFLSLLTDEEKAYIRDNPVIPFATHYNAYPISFYYRNDSEWAGIVFDILDELSVITGLDFELINEPNVAPLELMQMMESGEAYFMPYLIYSDERSERFLWAETPYWVDRFALLSKQSYPNIEVNDIPFERIGLPRGTAFADMFRLWFPDAIYAIEYPTTDDAFAAVEAGEIDFVMTSQSRLTGLTNYYELSDYKANFLFDTYFDVASAYNLEQGVLREIFEKALPLINTDRIAEQWVTRTYNLEAMRLQEQRPWLIGSLVLSLVIICLIVALFVRSRLTGKKLEKLVELRTNELSAQTAELRETEAELRVASESKSRFLADMSHEIRTPMNSIMGFAELAMDFDDIPPKVRGYLDNISKSAAWLLNIINDILDISKIESGKIELESIPFDIEETVNHCQSVIMPKATEKGLALNCVIEPSVGELVNGSKLLGDPVRLCQALMNLLSNAVKFTSAGEVNLTVSAVSDGDIVGAGLGARPRATTQGRPYGVTVRFEVKDSGIGMSPEQLERVFNPYAQGSSSISRKYGGTGLGLSITKNIIELMGGTLEVESEPDVGTTFSFELAFETDGTHALPNEDVVGATCGRLRAGTQARPYEGSDVPQPAAEKPMFDGEVLICEDNEMNRQVICSHLERVGVRYAVAENGKEGVEFVEGRMQSGEKPFDMVFMDVHMPVMDGLEATAKIKKLGVKTPIIAMTANIITSEMENYKRGGMVDSLGKPFTSKDLWECLMKYLPLRGAGLSARPREATQGLPCSVLVVDGESANIAALTEILSADYSVFIAKNGKSAIKLANKHMPSVIILDAAMPGMDGYETLRILKSDEATRDIPVILSVDTAGESAAAKRWDAAGHVIKPFDSDNVKRAVQLGIRNSK